MTRRIAGLVLCLTVGLTASPTWAAASNKPATTTTTIPTLHTSSGKLYKAGEFCAAKYLGKLDHGSGGLIKCERVKGADRWEPQQQSSQPTLSGIGATLAQMKAAHGLDMPRSGFCSSGPDCYGAGFTNEESPKPGFNYQFTAVSHDDGLIDGYTQAFNTGTTIAQAESQVLQWMPKDAKMTAITIDRNGGSCAMANISSATLAKLFSKAPKIGDPKGVIGVEFGYIDANLNQVYNSNNIEHADLSVAPSNPTAAC